MARSARIALVALALFLAAAGAGVFVASQWGPERTRLGVEEALSEQLGAPVTVGAATLHFGGGALSLLQGVLLDAEDIRTVEPDGPTLSVGRLQAELDPMTLLRGQVDIRTVALEGVRAHLRLAEPQADDPDAASLPAVSAPPPGDAGPGAEPVVGFLETVAAWLEETLRGSQATRTVTLEHSELELVAPPLQEGGPPIAISLRDVRGRVRRGLLGAASGTLTGALPAGGEGSTLEVEFQRNRRGALTARLKIERFALAAAAPVLTTFLPSARLDGSGRLDLEAHRPQEGVFRLSGRLEASGIEGVLPRLGDQAPVPVSLDLAQSGIDVSIDPEQVHVESAFVEVAGSALAVEAEIARPVAAASDTQARITLDAYDLTQRRHLIALLPPRQIARVDGLLEPLRSGHVEDVVVSGQAPLSDWTRAFDDEVEGLLPETVEARARFTRFAARAGEGETLTDLSGDVAFRGDRLELRGVRGRRGGHWMPILDATLEGVSNLSGNVGQPQIPDSPKAPVMLGLGPMYNIVVDPNRPPGEMPGALLLELERVVHPTLLWPLKNLFARAIPSEDGIRILIEHGIWGRVPIRAEGVWTMQPEGERRVERVSVRIGASPPLEGLARVDVSDPIWARGRWHLNAHNLGRWRVHKSTGAFQAMGQNVRLLTYDLDLGIAGRGLGEATIDFSQPDELPYWTTVRVDGAKAEGVVDKIGFEPHEATGDVVLDGEFHGALRPGRKVMAGMEGTLNVAARDGVILKHLPVILAVAKATDTFNPFRRRDELRYSHIDARLQLQRGRVQVDELRLQGPDARLLVNGTVEALDPLHPVEAVVGIFFFKALDRVIGVVPVLSDLLLGEDESLMGAYVEVTGPWREPEASLVPLKTLATGPASVAVEGVPRFVRRAIAAIQAAFERPSVSAPPPPRGEDS